MAPPKGFIPLFLFFLVFTLIISFSIPSVDAFTWNRPTLIEPWLNVNSSETWITDEGDMDNVPDLYPTLDTRYVEVAGDTMTGDLSFTNKAGITEPNYIYMNTTPTLQIVEEGLMQWNENDGTLNIGLAGGEVNLQVGQEQVTKVRNNLGFQVDNGKVVYISGALGETPTIGLADATDSEAINILGVATENISHNSNGFVTRDGLVRDIDTTGTPFGETWNEGEILYLGEGGNMSNTHPSSPNVATVIVGTVIKSSEEEGIILVNHESFTLGNNFEGTLRNLIINKNESGAVGFVAVNDLGYRATFGMGGSESIVFNNVGVLYNEGYNDTWFAVDGNKDFVWFIDREDRHTNGALEYEVMRLTSNGTLIVDDTVNATNGNFDNIYNRDEVDELFGSLSLELFFKNVTSGISTYWVMNKSANGVAKNFSSITLSADSTEIGGFISENASDLGIGGLGSGIVDGHFHANVDLVVGKKAVDGYMELWIRNQSGQEVKLTTSHLVRVDATDETEYEAHASLLNEIILNESDRIVMKLFANLSGAGGNPTLTTYIQGDTLARAEFGAIGVNFATQRDLEDYYKLDGTNNLTANVNGQGNNLTNWDGGFFNNLNATGDTESNTFTLNGTTINDWEDVDTNISINFGANESDTSGPSIPFLLTDEGVLKIEATEGSQSTIWEQVSNEIRNLVGNVFNFQGDIIATRNITTGDRFFLSNGGSIGDNSSCAFIFYNSSGNEISNLGCV